MAVFTYKVDLDGAGGEHAFNVQKIQFGDGYEQRRKTLLKPKMQTWSVKRTAKSAEIALIKAFLDARAGTEAFNWTPPKTTTALLVVVDEGYTETPRGGDVYEIAFKMREVMG